MYLPRPTRLNQLLFRAEKLLLVILLFSGACHAEISDGLSELKQRASDKKLSQQIEWRNLLHFSNGRSHVVDDSFFYAENGAHDPAAELNATLDAMYSSVSTDENEHAQCRFPARTKWLTNALNINTNSLPSVACKDYKDWRKQHPAGKVTMIFPAYHLNSPSSMFGHTLLRLDPADSDSDWLSLAINFGANVNENDNSIVYAFRGLAGGYPGTFATQPYYKKIQEYGRIEHRDIWEYPLNLSQDEIERMVSHLWELREVNFDYYFFDENCSYRLLELLEVARPAAELTDEFVLTAIPVDTVRSIEKAGMIESIEYRPAQATRLQFRLEQIPAHHRSLVIALSEDIDITESAGFKALEDKEQKNISELAYDYLRYQNTKEGRDETIAKRSFQLLQKINSYPADKEKTVSLPVPSPPEKSHLSKRLSFSLGERLDNSYAEFGFKFAFHDLEDNKNGFLQGAQINIGSIQLRAIDNEGLRLHQFDLVDIFSLTPRDEFFKPLSWKIYSGFERQLTNNKDQLSYHLTGGAGGTWEIVDDHQFYALAILRMEINKQLKNTIEPAIGFNTGFLSHFDSTTARLEFSGEQFEEGIYRLRAQYTQNFVISTNHSLKIFYKYQWQENDTTFSDINLSYQHYF